MTPSMSCSGTAAVSNLRKWGCGYRLVHRSKVIASSPKCSMNALYLRVLGRGWICSPVSHAMVSTYGGTRLFDWQFDHGRASVFLPHMRSIVGEALIGPAPKEEDQKHNTDLIVLRLEAVRIACRVRDWRYLERYADEFTIRQSRPSGVDSELGKIMFGWGDYILYGFGDLAQSNGKSPRLLA